MYRFTVLMAKRQLFMIVIVIVAAQIMQGKIFDKRNIRPHNLVLVVMIKQYRQAQELVHLRIGKEIDQQQKYHT